MKQNTTHPAILLAADSPEQLRACDVERVHDAAMDMGLTHVVAIKKQLRLKNPIAFQAMLAHEQETYPTTK